MVFGGSNQHHERGDLETQIERMRRFGGGLNDRTIGYLRSMYEAESFNHSWRVALDPDGDIGEITFGRAGARISEQSEGAVAVVVGL